MWESVITDLGHSACFPPPPLSSPPLSPKIAYQSPWSQPTSTPLSRLPSHRRFDVLLFYCAPATAGQCPHPTRRIYRPCFCSIWHPCTFASSPCAASHSERVRSPQQAFIISCTGFALSPAMPLPTTPQRPRTSSLKLSRVKVRCVSTGYGVLS